MLELQAQFGLEPFTAEPITVIDSLGEELPLSAPLLRQLYRDLRRARRLDEELPTLLATGKTSFYMQVAGHEAAQVGLAQALRPGKDWVFPYYRDTALVLSLGLPLVEFLAQLMATRADPSKGRQMPHHPSSRALNIFSVASTIAAHIPTAAGAALGAKLKRSGEVVLASFGEGATSEGEFHTGLNLAAVQKAPLLLACQNNGYAISVPACAQSAPARIVEKAHGYGIPGYLVDGMDPIASLLVAQAAVEQIREGAGPILIEFVVARFGPHSSSDDQLRYRPQAELEAEQKQDPIPRLAAFLGSRGLWDDAAEQALSAELEAEIDSAILQAEASGPVPPEWMFDDVYAEPTPLLQLQRNLLDEEIS